MSESSATYAVLLNWNGWPDTLACLEAVAQMRSAPERVLVVDNGSTDDSVARIRAAAPQHTLLETGRNLGFAAGANVGIRRALEDGADRVWLLNNDTVPDPAALAAMGARLDADPRLGIVGSMLRYAHDPSLIQALGGGYIHWWLGLPHHIRSETRLSRLEYVIGASMLVRRDVFDAIGLLDERFFLYWEDADFCRRAVRAGWRLTVAPESVVLHKEGGTASGGERRVSLSADVEHLRSMGRFMRKHHRLWPVPLMVRALAEVPNQLRYGTPGRLPALWRALWQGARERGPSERGRAH